MNNASKPDVARVNDRVVVLGGLGFIGSHLCRALVAHDRSVRVFDRPEASQDAISDFKQSIEIATGDIAKPEEVVDAIRDATVLINLVHTTVPGTSMLDPGLDIISNVASSARWLKHIGETSLRKIIYFSSGGTVYGESKKPIAEDYPTNPLNSYGITKLAVEKYTAMYATHADIDYCIVRPSNVYGPGQQLHYGQGVIGIMASRALRGERLEVWGEGTDHRDFLYVDDLVRAILRLLDYNGSVRVFNVSSGVGHSVLDVIEALKTSIQPFPEVVHTPKRPIDVPLNILDSSKLQSETGWKPTTDFDQGVSRTIDWMKMEYTKGTKSTSQ